MNSPLKNATNHVSSSDEHMGFDDFDLEPPPLPKNFDYVDELFSTNNINAAVRSVSPSKVVKLNDTIRKFKVFRDDSKPNNTTNTTNPKKSHQTDLMNSSGPLLDITKTASNMTASHIVLKSDGLLPGSSFRSFKERTPHISLQPSDFDLPPKSTSTPQDTTFLKTPTSIFSEGSHFKQSTPVMLMMINSGTNSTMAMPRYGREFDGYSTPKHGLHESSSQNQSPHQNTNVSVLSSSLIEDISVDESFDLYSSPLARRRHTKARMSPTSNSYILKSKEDDDIARVAMKLKNSRISSEYSPLNTDDYISFDIRRINSINSSTLSSEDLSLPDAENSSKGSIVSFGYVDSTGIKPHKVKKKVRIHEHILVIPSDSRSTRVKKRSLEVADSSDENSVARTTSRKRVKSLTGGAKIRSTEGSSSSKSITQSPNILSKLTAAANSSIGTTTTSEASTISDMMNLVTEGKDPINLLE